MSSHPSLVDKIRSEVSVRSSASARLRPYTRLLCSKSEAFNELLTEKGALENNKSLFFTTFRHTLAHLERHAATTELRVGVDHRGIADEVQSEPRQLFSWAEMAVEKRASTTPTKSLICNAIRTMQTWRRANASAML